MALCFLRYIYITSSGTYIINDEYYNIYQKYDIDKEEIKNKKLESDGLIIFHFSGFLFFGAISRICNELSIRIDDDIDKYKLGYIILDFSNISDIDTTSVVQLSELSNNYCTDAFIYLVVSSESYLYIIFID